MSVEQAEEDAAFHRLAQERWADVQATGLTVPWDEFTAWREARAGRTFSTPAGTSFRALIGAVAQLEVALKALDDFDRFVAHLERFSVADPPARIAEIIEALQMLVRNPMIGRPAPGGERKLLIGTGSHGYVALHRFEKKRGTPLWCSRFAAKLREATNAAGEGSRWNNLCTTAA